MDDDTRRRLLRALLGEDQPGRGRVRRWTLLEAAERAGLVLRHAQRGLQALREHDPPLVWGDADGASGGEELWWLLPDGLNELDRLELALAEDELDALARSRPRDGVAAPFEAEEPVARDRSRRALDDQVGGCRHRRPR